MASIVSTSACWKRAMALFSLSFNFLTFLPIRMVIKTTMGLNINKIKPSCQSINNKTMAVPIMDKTATINLLMVALMNWSTTSISVTKCEAKPPLPTVSYSLMAIFFRYRASFSRICKVMDLAKIVNMRICQTLSATENKRNNTEKSKAVII